MNSTFRATVLALALATAGLSAQAELVTKTGVRNTSSTAAPTADDGAGAAFDDFKKFVTITGTETFSGNGFQPGAPLDFPFTLTSTILGATFDCAETDVTRACFVKGEAATGRYDITKDTDARFLESELRTTGAIKLSFATAISAFGFFGTDIGDFGSGFKLKLTDSDGNETELEILADDDNNQNNNPVGGNLRFFGFYQTGPTKYSSIEFLNDNTGDVFGLDNISVGTFNGTTPEPTTLALLGLALTAGALARRRRTA